MSKTKFDAYETKAIDDLSPKLGEWIDKQIGSTDFSTWSEEQWLGFLKQAVRQFGDSMRAVTAELEPPF